MSKDFSAIVPDRTSRASLTDSHDSRSRRPSWELHKQPEAEKLELVEDKIHTCHRGVLLCWECTQPQSQRLL